MARFVSVEYLIDPYPFYHRLRAEEPVHWNTGARMWVLTRYADVVAALRHPSLSSTRARPNIDELPEAAQDAARSVYDHLSTWLLRLDPPDHARLRTLVSRALAPCGRAGLRPAIERIVDDLLDDVQVTGQLDIIADLAYPLTLTVIIDLIGLPRE